MINESDARAAGRNRGQDLPSRANASLATISDALIGVPSIEHEQHGWPVSTDPQISFQMNGAMVLSLPIVESRVPKLWQGAIVWQGASASFASFGDGGWARAPSRALALAPFQQKQSQQALRLSEDSQRLARRRALTRSLAPCLQLPYQQKTLARRDLKLTAKEQRRVQQSQRRLALVSGALPRMVLGLRTLGKGLRAGAGVAAGTAKAVAWVAVGTVVNVGRVVLAAKAAVTGEHREESLSGEKELVALTNPEAELTQPEEGANSSDALMTPVPEEAFEPSKEEVADMGAESVLEAEAPASTAEASSAGRASWCGGGQWVCRGRDQSAGVSK